MRLEQPAFGVQHFQIGGRAGVVAQLRQASALGLSLQRGLGDLELFGQPAACGQSVRDLAERRLDGLFVLGDGDVAARLG